MRGMEKYVFLAFAIVLAVGVVFGAVVAGRERKRERTRAARGIGARVAMDFQRRELRDRFLKKEQEEEFRRFMREADELERMRK